MYSLFSLLHWRIWTLKWKGFIFQNLKEELKAKILKENPSKKKLISISITYINK